MESFYDRGSINLNNKEKLIQDNYSKVNQISARCMRVIVAILALAFVYCYFGTDMDELGHIKKAGADSITFRERQY